MVRGGSKRSHRPDACPGAQGYRTDT